MTPRKRSRPYAVGLTKPGCPMSRCIAVTTALKAGAQSMTRPHKVAFLITSMNRGGTESRLLDVLRCLDRSQFDPFLYVAKNRGDLLAEIHDQRVFVWPSNS